MPNPPDLDLCDAFLVYTCTHCLLLRQRKANRSVILHHYISIYKSHLGLRETSSVDCRFPDGQRSYSCCFLAERPSTCADQRPAQSWSEYDKYRLQLGRYSLSKCLARVYSAAYYEPLSPAAHNTSLPSEPITSPGPIVSSENQLRALIVTQFKNRIRHALRATFDQFGNQLQGPQGLTRVSYDEGEGARILNNYKPDTAFFDETMPATTSWNRAPGEVKPSWKWTSNLRNSPLPAGRREFRQVLSRLNFYMKQHHARYGYIITDLELVPVRRRDNGGNLDLAQPIAWNARGNPGNEQLTVMLALWYLGMLAAQNNGPGNWNI
ncbi:conserved hypothetical protein [Histoplasma capsulatum var. duboisii H88]|uniref:Uncharacterized protein n=2 Tax=Ajellomyces capsulatus TaxID=5037 RepID=F0U696_AJEC8|nr:conserved hypothetical protein [Histoplasma capsulatum H143]EGC40641.1 conserved hypothetical protein [Histoplasma capsulatum var. duboisii H88]QSS52918.1 hypothetical protein I7I53_08688 [Histoplasma capsulatum var. duboisii H88]